jgi:hypothetical protein
LFFFEIGTFVGAAYGALIGGTQRMLSGGDFGEGAVDGFILGAKIGGTIGAAADGYTGGYATWTDSNPFFTLAAHTYAEAWNGRAGGGYGFGLDLNAGAGGGGNPAAPLYQPQYPQELSDGFDAYTQTGAVPESDFCYPCGGPLEDLSRAVDTQFIKSIASYAFENEDKDPYSHQKAAYGYGAYVGNKYIAGGARFTSEMAQFVYYSVVDRGKYDTFSKAYIIDSYHDVANTMRGATRGAIILK